MVSSAANNLKQWSITILIYRKYTIMKTYFEYTISKDSFVRSVYAKDAATAKWAIIERHGVDVKVRWMERRQEKEINKKN